MNDDKSKMNDGLPDIAAQGKRKKITILIIIGILVSIFIGA